MTPEWKANVRRRLEESGETHNALETRVGCGKGQIAKMLADGQTASVWVAQVSAALGISTPGVDSDDERTLLRNYQAASPEGKRALLEHAAAAAGAGRPRA